MIPSIWTRSSARRAAAHCPHTGTMHSPTTWSAGCVPERCRQCGGSTGASSRVRRARLPVASSLRSALPRMRTIARDATKRSGSGSQRRLRWPTQGRMTRSVSFPRTRSASVRPGDVRGDDAVAGVAAGPAEPGRAIEVHRHRPVAGDAQRPAPVVRDRWPTRRRGSGAGSPARAARAPRRCARSRRRWAGSAGTARRARRSRSGRPGALRVEEQVAHVAHEHAVRPADLVPHRGGSGSVAIISEYSGR